MANTETMTITAALVELKTLASRIDKAINQGTYVGIHTPNVTEKSIEAIQNECVASYQSVTDLIHRRDAIRRAIIQSNATTTVECADLPPKADGTLYTVAEVIDLKAHGAEYLRMLSDVLQRNAMQAKSAYEKRRMEIERTAQDIRKTIAGTSNDPGSNERATDAYNAYIAENAPTLVDPNDIIEKIKELNEQVTAIVSKTDVALSIINATTTITVTY